MTGRRIAEAVRRSGKDVIVVAREAGISPSALHRAMAGKGDVRAQNLAGIARSTSTTPDALLDFDEPAAANLSIPQPPRQAVEAGMDVLRLSGPDRRAVMQLVRSLLADNPRPKESDTTPSAGSARSGRAMKART